MTTALLVNPGLSEFEWHSEGIYSDDANAATLWEGFDAKPSGRLHVAVPHPTKAHRLMTLPFSSQEVQD